MRDVSTKQAALTVIGITVVLAAVLYLATFFKAWRSNSDVAPLDLWSSWGHPTATQRLEV